MLFPSPNTMNIDSTSSMADPHKLEGARNFPMWKVKMHILFRRDSVWYFMSPQDINEVVELINLEPNMTTSLQHDKYKAMLMLIMSIRDNIIHHIVDIDDPTQVWQTLHNLFDNKNAARTMLLFNQLHSTVMDKGSSITHYLQKMNELATQLQSIGEEVP